MEQKKFTLEFLCKEYVCLYIKETSIAEAAVLDLLDSEGPFGLDIETQALQRYSHIEEAALSPQTSAPRLIQIFDSVSEIIYIFDMNHVELGEEFFELLETKIFVAHNAMFELQFFKAMGVKRMNINCSQIAATLVFHALYPTDAGSSVSLANLVKQLFGVELKKDSQASNWGEPDLLFEQIEYAGLDALASFLVMDKLSKAIAKFRMGRAYKLARDVQNPLASMQLRGITFDITRHKGLMDQWRRDLLDARLNALRIMGIPSITPTHISNWLESNLTEEALQKWPKTATKKLSASKDTFAMYSHLPMVEPLLIYQKQETLLSTYGAKLVEKISPETKRLHGSFKIHGARTGRFSAYEPNLQNAPHDKPFRNLFKARPGYTFICADYNQIELRIAAHLSKDKAMLNAYATGIDLHRLTASQVARVSLEQVTPAQRQMAKAVNFGILYGIGAEKFSNYAKNSYKVEVSREEAEEAIQIFRQTYKEYRKWQLLQAQEAEYSFISTTPCGKVRRLPTENTYTTSMNTPIQGGSAECISYAMIRFDATITKENLDCGLVNFVHDEMLAEARIEEAEVIQEFLTRDMIKGVLDVFPDIIQRGLIESHIADRWGDAK